MAANDEMQGKLSIEELVEFHTNNTIENLAEAYRKLMQHKDAEVFKTEMKAIITLEISNFGIEILEQVKRGFLN